MRVNRNSVATAIEDAPTNVRMVATADEERAATVTENRKMPARLSMKQMLRSASDKVNTSGRAASEFGKVTAVINSRGDTLNETTKAQ